MRIACLGRPQKQIPARLRASPLGVDVHTLHSERVANQPGSPKTKESAASAKQAHSNLDVRIHPRRTWFRQPLGLRGTHDNPHSTFQLRTAGSHPIDTQGFAHERHGRRPWPRWQEVALPLTRLELVRRPWRFLPQPAAPWALGGRRFRIKQGFRFRLPSLDTQHPRSVVRERSSSQIRTAHARHHVSFPDHHHVAASRANTHPHLSAGTGLPPHLISVRSRNH